MNIEKRLKSAPNGHPGSFKAKKRGNLNQIDIRDHDNEFMETNDALEELGYTDGYSIPGLAPASTYPELR